MELTIELINKDLRDALKDYNETKNDIDYWKRTVPEGNWDSYLKHLELKISQHKKALKILLV